MQSTALDSLPPKLRRSLAKLEGDIAAARRKRSLTVMMMAERIGSAKSTYLKVEKGDPSVSMVSMRWRSSCSVSVTRSATLSTLGVTIWACCSMPSGCQSACVPRKCRPRCEAKRPRRTWRKRPRSRHPPFRCGGRPRPNASHGSKRSITKNGQAICQRLIGELPRRG